MLEIMETFTFTNIIWQIITPFLFMLFDIVTGLIQAFINNNPDSRKMREGLLHKIILILIILMSFILDYTFNLNFISKSVCLYIITMEIISILENIQKAGIKMDWFKNIMEGEKKHETK